MLRRRFGIPGSIALAGLLGVGVAGATPITEEEFWATVEEPIVTVDGVGKSFTIEPIFDEVNDQLVVGYYVPQQTLTWASGDKVSTTGASYALFDPVITLAIGVVDFGLPSNFTTSTAAPLAPMLTGPVTGSLTISGSFADGASNGGSASPFLTALIAQATIEGVGVADAGPMANFATPGDVYGPFTVNYNDNCVNFGGTCDSFDLQISFTGSGGADAISFTARHELVPEPATAALVGLGLLGLAIVGRRRD